jgi:hypothetical protein
LKKLLILFYALVEVPKWNFNSLLHVFEIYFGRGIKMGIALHSILLDEFLFLYSFLVLLIVELVFGEIAEHIYGLDSETEACLLFDLFELVLDLLIHLVCELLAPL